MNNKSVELRNAIRSVRQQGSTTYLLDAAINNPNVTIITANQGQAKQLEEQYKHRVAKLPFWKKLFRKSGTPKFVSVRNFDQLAGTKTPVIIDLYAVASSI